MMQADGTRPTIPPDPTIQLEPPVPSMWVAKGRLVKVRPPSQLVLTPPLGLGSLGRS